MINLINRLLTRFDLKLVSTKPVDLVAETVKCLNTFPKDFLRNDSLLPPYVGDVVYVNDNIGNSYFRVKVLGMEDKYYDYNGDTYTTEELQEKLQ